MNFKDSDVTLLLLQALGYQGGTIHQASKETGLSVSEILTIPHLEHQIGLGSAQSCGFSSILTNSLIFNREKVFPKFKGNAHFWLGACRAQAYKNHNIIRNQCHD